MHIGPRDFARQIFLVFSAPSTTYKMAAQILCPSLELELLHGFVSCLVQRNNSGCVLISFLCGYFLGFLLIFQFCLFWLLSKFGNMAIQLILSFEYAHWP